MKILVITLMAVSMTGCAATSLVTQDERIQIRQSMARLQTQNVQNKIIGYRNDQHNK
jgi:hypothetical protein